jgi:GMP synthase (glutamine-hydrolysing)
MTMTALVLQHAPEEPGGLFEEFLLNQGWKLEVIPLFSIPNLPPLRKRFELILVLGGPMSANNEDRYPFLKQELLFLKRALKLGHPVFGICLGAQLMAKALGARVYPGPYKEIGWYWLNKTSLAKRDPLFSLLDPYFLVFQWHGETFDLPSDAICLAGNDTYPHQAFRFGSLAYGVQFHLELTEELLRTWLASWSDEIGEARPQPLSAGEILEDAVVYLDRLQAQARQVFSCYLKLLEKK